MARMRDEGKRRTIIESAKVLFSRKGFFNTAISDIVRETDLPVGTIYTYFSSKEEIVKVIVEEGWADIYGRLEAALKAQEKPQDRLRFLIDGFLPELIADLDLISILLTEAAEYTRMEEKLGKLTDLVTALISPLVKDKEVLKGFARRSMEAAVAVLFLGVLNAVKIARAGSIDLGVSDVADFLRVLVSSSLDLKA